MKKILRKDAIPTENLGNLRTHVAEKSEKCNSKRNFRLVCIFYRKKI